MCKIKETNVGIKRLSFRERRGKMAVYLTDGREMIVPLTFFPDIKRLPMRQREEWMILDDQFFTFNRLSNVYSVTDIVKM